MASKDLIFRFIGLDAGAGREFDRMAAKSTGLAASFGPVSKGLLGLGAAAAATGAAIAVESVRMAGDFQTAMTRIHTQADASNHAVAQLSDGILKMAGSVGTAPKVLADAAYHIASIGQHSLTTAQQLQVLRIASEGAKIGGANLVDVTNALDAALVSHIKGVSNYSQAMGVLNSTVGAGDMSMQDLADAFGPLGSTFKGFGVSIQQAGAALAVFGDNNLRGALAGSQLRQSITALAVPTAFGATQLQAWGDKAGNMQKQLKQGGLTAALDYLDTLMRKNGITAQEMGPKLAEMFGKRGPQQGLSMLLNELDRFHGKLDEVSKGGSGFASSWKGYTKTFQYNLDAAKSAVQSLAIQLGTKLLPYATSALHWLATDGVKYLKDFGDWFHRNESTIGHFGAFFVQVMQKIFQFSTVAFKGILDGAAKGFGWIPGIGGKLKSAAHAFDDFYSTSNTIMTKLASNLNNLGNQAGTNLSEGVGRGINGGRGRVVANARAVAAAGAAALRGGSSAAHAAGVNLGDSYAAGIAQTAAATGVSAARIVENAINAVNHAQQSHSPSRVGWALGGWFGEGYWRGIEAQADKAANAAAQLARRAAAAARRAVRAEVASAVAPPVTDPSILASLFGHAESGAIGRQADANIAQAHYRELQEHADALAKVSSGTSNRLLDIAKNADTLSAAIERLRAAKLDASSVDAAERYAKHLSNLAYNAHKAAEALGGTGKAARAAKSAAEAHARSLDQEARDAKSAAEAMKKHYSTIEQAASHAADKAKASYDKIAQAAQNAAQKAEDAATALVASVQSSVDAVQQKIQDFTSAMSQGLTGDFSLSSIWQSLSGTDANGDPMSPSLEGVQGNLDGILAAAKQFASDLNALAGEGASSSLLQQLAGMGPTAGDALTQQLLTAGKASVQHLSSTFDQISQFSTDAASQLASGFYGGGVSAMEQFVKGLMRSYPELRAALRPLLSELQGLFGSDGSVIPASSGVLAGAGSSSPAGGGSGSGGTTVQVTFTGPVYGTDSATLAESVAVQLNRMSLSGPVLRPSVVATS